MVGRVAAPGEHWIAERTELETRDTARLLSRSRAAGRRFRGGGCLPPAAAPCRGPTADSVIGTAAPCLSSPQTPSSGPRPPAAGYHELRHRDRGLPQAHELRHRDRGLASALRKGLASLRAGGAARCVFTAASSADTGLPGTIDAASSCGGPLGLLLLGDGKWHHFGVGDLGRYFPPPAATASGSTARETC